jgi:RpiB/LacA/LacB family sugar-phosphate isomerase
MKTILFVCTGNVCRSPMAEWLFRHAVRNQSGFRVFSAGLGAINGQPPSVHAVRAMRELGVDLSGFRSRMLSADLVHGADYIFGMTRGHVEGITLLYPQAAEKTFLLREFDETLGAYEKDIADPIGGSLEVYLECRDQIEKGVAAVLKFIDQTEHMTDDAHSSSRTPSLVLGADHAGYPLKEAVKGCLQAAGYAVTDVGAHGVDSVDYPDYAQLVASKVVSGEFDLGLLFCKTGVGMSIAANKVPGVRAALATSTATALLARQHNNANILCLGAETVTTDEAPKLVEAFLAASFEGGRHERRVSKLEAAASSRVDRVDPEIAEVLHRDESCRDGGARIGADQ